MLGWHYAIQWNNLRMEEAGRTQNDRIEVIWKRRTRG
jgi:cell division protein FtsL